MLLRVIDITKRFGGLIALSKINFQIEEGEVVGMIGSNGSGKTTFVNICTGFIRPEGGYVFLDEQNITRLAPHDCACLGLSRTYQTTKLFRNLSVSENMITANQAHYQRLSRKNAQEGIRPILEKMDIADKASEISGSLSLFEQKKLEIGMRLISQPKILMLDEPVGGLSPTEIEKMLTMLRMLKKEINLFVIEHTMRVIFSLADRVIVLNSGNLLANGTPKEISKNQDVIDAYLGSRCNEGV